MKNILHVIQEYGHVHLTPNTQKYLPRWDSRIMIRYGQLCSPCTWSHFIGLLPARWIRFIDLLQPLLSLKFYEQVRESSNFHVTTTGNLLCNVYHSGSSVTISIITATTVMFPRRQLFKMARDTGLFYGC